MTHRDNRQTVIIKVSNQEQRLVYDKVDKTYVEGVFYCLEWCLLKHYVLRIPLANIIWLRESFGGKEQNEKSKLRSR